MGLFERIHGRERKDIPMPERGLKRFFSVLFTHFWKFIGVNLLFALFSVPVVTLPAALCAMNRVLVKLTRDGNVLLWEEFRDEFKADVLSAFLPGLLFASSIFGAYFFMSLASGNSAYPGWCLLFWCVGIFLLIFGVCTGETFFVMKAELALRFKDLLKNAVLLSAAEFGTSFTVLASVLTAVFTMAVLMPFSLFLMLLFVPALTQYIVCFSVNSIVQKNVIGPYENREKEKN